MSMSTLTINGTIDDILKDIERTHDPLRKIILKKLLDVKIKENQKSIQEDYSQIIAWFALRNSIRKMRFVIVVIITISIRIA